MSGIKSRMAEGRTSLHIAARKNDSLCTKTLIDAGSNVEAKDNDQETPISFAAWKMSCDTVLLLLDYNAKTEHLNSEEKRNVQTCKLGENIYIILYFD